MNNVKKIAIIDILVKMILLVAVFFVFEMELSRDFLFVSICFVVVWFFCFFIDTFNVRSLSRLFDVADANKDVYGCFFDYVYYFYFKKNSTFDQMDRMAKFFINQKKSKVFKEIGDRVEFFPRYKEAGLESTKEELEDALNSDFNEIYETKDWGASVLTGSIKEKKGDNLIEIYAVPSFIAYSKDRTAITYAYSVHFIITALFFYFFSSFIAKTSPLNESGSLVFLIVAGFIFAISTVVLVSVRDKVVFKESVSRSELALIVYKERKILFEGIRNYLTKEEVENKLKEMVNKN